MEATTTKDLLHLRIEQADDKLLTVLAELTETLFKSYQPEVIEEEPSMTDNPEEADKMAVYEATLKPMTKQELLSEIREGLADYHRGDYVTLDELEWEAKSTYTSRTNAPISPSVIPPNPVSPSTTLKPAISRLPSIS